MFRAVFLHCWRIKLVCPGLRIVGSWFKLGFSVGMEAFGWAFLDYCSLESGVFWCSHILDLSLLPLAFSLILTVASRLLYSRDDKTSRLMVKQFSTVRDTQRGSRSYTEKRRCRREIEVTRRRRGAVKRGETDLASNQFPSFLHSPEHLERCTEWSREEKGEGGDRDYLVEKRESQKQREQSSQ